MTESPGLKAAVFYYQHRIQDSLEVQDAREDACYLAGPEPMPVGSILAIRLQDEGRLVGPFLPGRVEHVDERPRRAKEGRSGMRIRFLELEEEVATFWKEVRRGSRPADVAGDHEPEDLEPPVGAERSIPEPRPQPAESAQTEQPGAEPAERPEAAQPGAEPVEQPETAQPAVEAQQEASEPGTDTAQTPDEGAADQPEGPSTEVVLEAESAEHQERPSSVVSGEIQTGAPAESSEPEQEPSVVAVPQEPPAEESGNGDQAAGGGEDSSSQPKKKRRRGRRKKKRR